MLLRILSTVALVGTAASQAGVNTKIWTTEKADVTQASTSDKLEVPLASATLCAGLATSITNSDLFCYNGLTCVVVITQNLNGIRGVENVNWNCFLTGSRCRPPFAEYPGLGCLNFHITNLVDFPTAKASCIPGSSLWYPLSNDQNEAMRNYLVNDRYAAPAGGACGPSVPLADGEPGPCTSSALGDYCCNAGGTCGRASADCTCTTCIDYKTQAKAFYIDLVEVNNVTWKYGNGRTIPAEVGVLPWGPNDPKYVNSCGSLWMAPVADTYYHHSDTDCTRPCAYICAWD
ncbi:hypothetical protein FHG87_015961 [Trinorchestia longiramus]|nr:hypothetical protein FHG87_015961 [Trinorchestia longiramus]